MINCVIIEDEPLAQTGLINLIKLHEDKMKVLAVCDDVADFLQFKQSAPDKAIDLLFLDIELPGINGISFLRESPLNIPVVLTTAYNQYAVDGYELNVLDYLLKPISKERFAQALGKIETYLNFLKSKSDELPSFLYIKSEKVMERVLFNELVMVEAMRNYVIYHCDQRRLISYSSLKSVEQQLPAAQFVKVQKSFIVNKNKVDRIEKGYVFVRNKQIAITRGTKGDIIKRLTTQ